VTTTQLLTFILMVYGVTHILVASRILHRIRPPFFLFHCHQCMGFHVGWLVALCSHVGWVDLGIDLSWPMTVPGVVLWGSLGSGTSLILGTLFTDLGIQVWHQTERNTQGHYINEKFPRKPSYWNKKHK